MASDILSESQLANIYDLAQDQFRLSDPGSCGRQRAAACQSILTLIASYRALKAQVRELEGKERLWATTLKVSRDERLAAEARITVLEAMLTKLIKRNEDSWGGIADYADIWDDAKELVKWK
jgi:hypothetical protein